MKQFQQLITGQFLCFFIAGLFVVTAIGEHGLSASVVPSLALSAILAAVAWIGTQIVHELAEINDQLAGRGRSNELHNFLSELKKSQ